MTVEKRTLISFNDILAIEYECPHCQVRHSVPIEKVDRILFGCPNCNEPLISQARKDVPDEAVISGFIKSVREIQRRSFPVILRLHITGAE